MNVVIADYATDGLKTGMMMVLLKGEMPMPLIIVTMKDGSSKFTMPLL
jgi:hypothetical protein